MGIKHFKNIKSLVSILLLLAIGKAFAQNQNEAVREQQNLIQKYIDRKLVFMIDKRLCMQASERFPVKAWQKLLDKILDQRGQVNYPLLQKTSLKFEFQALVNKIGLHEIKDKENPCTQLAFWINTYNVLTIKQVLNYPRLKSVATAVSNAPRYTFFKQKKHKINHKSYSLDDIEHKLIRARFNDPRVHFALNCASQSCPQLHEKVFSAQMLDKQLETVSARFINDPQRNLYTAKQWKLSKIFDWYRQDFQAITKETDSQKSIQKFIRAYLRETNLTHFNKEISISLSFLEYDWSLNGISPK